MPTRRQFCAAAAVATAAPQAAFGRSSTQMGFTDAEIRWRDFASGAAEARETGAPILLLVHTTWCPHCHAYRKRFFDKKAVRMLRYFTPVLLDQDEEPEISARYQTDGLYIPRTMFLDAQARLQPQLHLGYESYVHFVDYQHPRALRRLLSAAIRHFKLR